MTSMRPAPAVTDNANVATPNNSPTCNADHPTQALQAFYARCAAFQRTSRLVALTCTRCGEQFEIGKRGHWRSKKPGICPTCTAKRVRLCARNWRKSRRLERLQAQASRQCESCQQPMPDGRTDRRHCAPACRQVAYRRRRAEQTNP